MIMFILLVIIVFFVVVGLRAANQNYTAGSGLFKRSDNNLEKDEHLDISDYNYYNNKDKLK